MTTPPVEWQAVEWQEFRRAREDELGAEYGWLCLTGFHWLPERPAPLPHLPGLWSADADRARLDAGPEDGLVVDGLPFEGTSLRTVAPTTRADWARAGDTRIEVLNRGGRYAVRTRVPSTPAREAFTGVPTFDYDPAWVITGHFHPYEPERLVEVNTIRPDLVQQLRGLGEVVFVAGGQPQRLVVTTIKAGPSIEFHDPTNGDTTPAWRQLKFDEPGPDGTVTLDFNRTLDMWFAFTENATCPAPLAGQAVTVPVTAGEKRPADA